MLKRYTLKTNLIVVMSVLSLLLAALGGWSLLNLTAANGRMRTMVEQRLLPMERLMRVSQALDQGRYGLVSAIVDPLNIDKDLDALAATLKAGEADWTAVQQAALSDAERALAQRYGEQYAALKDRGIAPAMEALRSVNLPGATELYGQNLLPLHAPARATLNELMTLQQSQAHELYERSQARYRLAMGLSGVAVLVGLAFATLMGFYLVRAVSRPLAQAVRIAEGVAGGDLTQHIEAAERPRNETEQLIAALARMNAGLQDIVREVRAGTEQIAAASGQIAGGNADLSGRTEQQASTVQQTAAAMEQLGGTVQANAASAAQADALAVAARRVAGECGAMVGQVVERMGAIQSASQRITDIIGVIDGIAFQTNLLALNAAVEAARAGELGRGFAVVAGEVRALAQRSAQAAQQVKGLIADTVAQVDSGSQLVERAGATMDEVVAGVQRVSTIVGEIAGASARQHQGIAEVGQSIVALDRTTQQNAALVEQASAAAESLRQQAAALARTVGRFRV